MRLIDTSAWVHSLRPDGDSDVRSRVRFLLEAGEAAWCPLVRLELWNGARGAHERKVLEELEQALPDLEISDAVWELACNMARKSRQRGKTVPATHLLVAACARHHGVGVEHADSHFDVLAAL